MADSEHLKILKQGIEAWNKWTNRDPSIRPNLGGVYLSGANLSGANFNRANLSAANLSGANLNRANLNAADLRWADLSEANLGGANLSAADLRWADLSEADLSNADLSGANLSEGANLIGADLSGANLSEANLSEGVILIGADLSAANLSGANLRATKLLFANLTRADLSNADVSGATFGSTVFGGVNLSTVKDLESCVHLGPSYLDYHTLAVSGRLPLNFLRNCGLSDEFIDYLPSLFSQAIEYYSCFISYSTKDQEFADRLYADLQNKGVRCWFAPHDIQGGKKIHEQIDEAIRKYERLLLILSEASMNSEWVKTEIANARQKEIKENRRVLFPIALVGYSKILQWKCFDADRGKDSAREIREYFIPDFSNWKNHDSYQNAFDRLLRDLKPEKVEANPE